MWATAPALPHYEPSLALMQNLHFRHPWRLDAVTASTEGFMAPSDVF